MIKLYYNKKHKIYYRKDTSDEFVITHNEYSRIKSSIEDKIILDIGAHIGTFARYVLKNGCKEVISFEADKSNYRILLKNLISDKQKTHYGFVTSSNKKTCEFYLNTKRGTGSHSAYTKSRSRKKVIVPCINFLDMINKYNPQIIKLDVEGAEYEILNVKIPECVKILVLEFHVWRKEWREDKIHKLLKNLEKQNFKIMKPMKYNFGIITNGFQR